MWSFLLVTALCMGLATIQVWKWVRKTWHVRVDGLYGQLHWPRPVAHACADLPVYVQWLWWASQCMSWKISRMSCTVGKWTVAGTQVTIGSSGNVRDISGAPAVRMCYVEHCVFQSGSKQWHISGVEVGFMRGQWSLPWIAMDAIRYVPGQSSSPAHDISATPMAKLHELLSRVKLWERRARRVQGVHVSIAELTWPKGTVHGIQLQARDLQRGARHISCEQAVWHTSRQGTQFALASAALVQGSAGGSDSLTAAQVHGINMLVQGRTRVACDVLDAVLPGPQRSVYLQASAVQVTTSRANASLPVVFISTELCELAPHVPLHAHIPAAIAQVLSHSVAAQGCTILAMLPGTTSAPSFIQHADVDRLSVQVAAATARSPTQQQPSSQLGAAKASNRQASATQWLQRVHSVAIRHLAVQCRDAMALAVAHSIFAHPARNTVSCDAVRLCATQHAAVIAAATGIRCTLLLDTGCALPQCQQLRHVQAECSTIVIHSLPRANHMWTSFKQAVAQPKRTQRTIATRAAAKLWTLVWQAQLLVVKHQRAQIVASALCGYTFATSAPKFTAANLPARLENYLHRTLTRTPAARQLIPALRRLRQGLWVSLSSWQLSVWAECEAVAGASPTTVPSAHMNWHVWLSDVQAHAAAALAASTVHAWASLPTVKPGRAPRTEPAAAAEASWRKRLAQAASKLPGPVRVLNVRAGCALCDEEQQALVDARVAVKAARLSADLAVHWQAVDARVQGAGAAGKPRSPSRATLPAGSVCASTGPTFQVHLPAGSHSAALSIEWALIDQLLVMAKRASLRGPRATPDSDKQSAAQSKAWDVRLCIDVQTCVQLELANGTRLVNQFASARARHVRCGAALADTWNTFWAVSTHDGALLANDRLVGSTAAVHFASSSLAGAALVASSHLDRFLRGGPVAGEHVNPASLPRSPASTSSSSGMPGDDAAHESSGDDAYTMPSSGSDTEYEEMPYSSPHPAAATAQVGSPALAPIPVSAPDSDRCPAYIIHDARVIWSPHAIQAVLGCVAALHHVRSAWKRRFEAALATSPSDSPAGGDTALPVIEQSASMVLPPVLELPTVQSSSPDAWSQSDSSPEPHSTPSGFPSAIPRVLPGPGSAPAAGSLAVSASNHGLRRGQGGSSTVQRLLRERGPGPTPRVNAPLPLHIIDDDVPLSPLATTRTVASSVGLSMDDRSHWSDAAAAWLGLDGSASVKSMFSPAGGAAAGERGLPSTPVRLPPPHEGSASTATTSKAKSPLTPSTWLNSHAPSARLASAGDFLLKMKATGLQILVIPDGADDDQATLQEAGAYGLLIAQGLRAHVLRKLVGEDMDAGPSAKTLELQAVLSQAVLCGATADTVAAALPAAGVPRRLAALFTSWDKSTQPWRARPSQWLSQAGKLSEMQLVWCAVRPPHSAFSAQMGQSRSMSPCSADESPGVASGEDSGVEDEYDDSSGSEMPLATNRSWLLSIQVPRIRASTHAVLARACAGVIRQAGASARGIKIAWAAALAALRGERLSTQTKPKAAFHIEVLIKTAWLSALEHGSQQARMRVLVRAFSLRGRHSVRGPRRFLRTSATIGWVHMWRSVPCSGPSLADQEVARWHSIFGGHVQANALTPADRMVTITAVLDWARAENGTDSIRLRHGEVALFPSIPGTVIAEVHRDDVGFIRQFIRDVAHAGPMITHARTPGPAAYDSASSAAVPGALALTGTVDAEPLFDAAQPMNAASSAFLLGTSLRGASRTMTHKPSKSSTQSGTAAASSHLGLSPGVVPSTPSSVLANAEANVCVTLFRVHQLSIQSSLDGWMGVSVRNIFTSLPEFSVRNTRCSMAQLLDDILSHYVGALRKLAPKLLTKAALHRGRLGLPGRTVLGSDAMSAAASRADSSHSTLNSDTPASSSGAMRGGEPGTTARKPSRQLAAMAPPPAHVFTGRGGARPLAHQRIGRVLEAAAARRKLQHEGGSGLEEGGPDTPEYGPADEVAEATPLQGDSAPPPAPTPVYNIAEQFLGMGDKPGQRSKLKRAVKSMLGRK